MGHPLVADSLYDVHHDVRRYLPHRLLAQVPLGKLGVRPDDTAAGGARLGQHPEVASASQRWTTTEGNGVRSINV